MKIIMFLNDQQLDVVEIGGAGRLYLNDLIEELKQKHKTILSKSSTAASFVIEGIPSSLNHFRSLSSFSGFQSGSAVDTRNNEAPL